jgi:flagellar protein FliS
LREAIGDFPPQILQFRKNKVSLRFVEFCETGRKLQGLQNPAFARQVILKDVCRAADMSNAAGEKPFGARPDYESKEPIMNARASALAAYSQVANAEPHPLQRIVMLYDGAIKFLRFAAADIETGNLSAKAEHTGRALDILHYLQSTLDFERGGEVAPMLDVLYASVTAMTIRASAKLDAALMLEAAMQLVPVRDAWAVNAGNTLTLNPRHQEVMPEGNRLPGEVPPEGTLPGGILPGGILKAAL